MAEVATGLKDAVLAGNDAADFFPHGVDGLTGIHPLSFEPLYYSLKTGVTAIATSIDFISWLTRAIDDESFTGALSAEAPKHGKSVCV
jgi:hypothetical protein